MPPSISPTYRPRSALRPSGPWRVAALLAAGLLVAGPPAAPAQAGDPPARGGDEATELSDAEPTALLLTWQRDPTRTMTIDWQVRPEHSEALAEPRLRYRSAGAEEWKEVRAESHGFPFSDRTIHRVELTDLEPGTTYHFQVGGFQRQYRFRTMPERPDAPVVFAVGGDTRHRQEWMERTNRVAMLHDLDFIVWGGDFAYADGREDRLYRWYEWFEAIMNTLVTDEGRVVPIVAGIGNHEVRQGYYYRWDDYEQTDAKRAESAPYFYSLLAFPGQPGYNVLDFGEYLSLVMLDSDHSNPVEGEQTEWLEKTLAERTGIPHVLPVYHVPAFPSVRDPGGRSETAVREHWVPLFERYGVQVAFENHDHTYKRTVPIRDGRRHPNGIVYFGDGAWGVRTRGVDHSRWYIARGESERHAIIVTLHGTHRHVRVLSEDGKVLDEYPAVAVPAGRPLTPLTVAGGSGSGRYLAGWQPVTIQADAPPPGQVFDRWTGDTGHLDDLEAATARIELPEARPVTVRATYRPAETYTLGVEHGSGGGRMAEESIRTIVANVPDGHVFEAWTGDVDSLEAPRSPVTTATMPKGRGDISVTATFSKEEEVVFAEQVRNPSFADGVEGWIVQENGVRIVEHADGTRHVALNPFSGIMQRVEGMDLETARRLTLYFEARLDADGGPFGFVGMQFLGEGGDVLASHGIHVRHQDWTPLAVSGEVVGNMAAPRIFAWMPRGEGHLHLRGLRLRVHAEGP